MESLTVYLFLTLTDICLILNIVATYIVFNTHLNLKEKKLYQTLFIWLIPFVGASLAIYLNREEYFENKHKKQLGNKTTIREEDVIFHSLGSDD